MFFCSRTEYTVLTAHALVAKKLLSVQVHDQADTLPPGGPEPGLHCPEDYPRPQGTYLFMDPQYQIISNSVTPKKDSRIGTYIFFDTFYYHVNCFAVT